MKGKATIRKQLNVKVTSETPPKVVKSYRIDPDVFETAEILCQKQHSFGVSSLIESLLIAYFGEEKFKKHG